MYSLKNLDGFRMKIDDLILLQENYTRLFVALAGMSGEANTSIDGGGIKGTSFVIDGCVPTISGGTISWTAGWIYYHGKVYALAASSLSYSGANRYWIIPGSVSSTKTRQTFSGSSTYHWQFNQASVSAVPIATDHTALGYIDIRNARRFTEAIHGLWVSLDAPDFPTAGGVITADNAGTITLLGGTVCMSYRITPRSVDLACDLPIDLGGSVSNTCGWVEVTLPSALIAPLSGTQPRLLNAVLIVGSTRHAITAEADILYEKIKFYLPSGIAANSTVRIGFAGVTLRAFPIP